MDGSFSAERKRGEFLMPTDYLVTDTELTDIADAIRAKGGTSAQLSFPNGYTTAIAAIPTGINPSGTINITSAGTTDVTNYAIASVAAGTEGTPTATKGAVNNHAIAVTPSVTNSAGYIAGGTKTGTAVSVAASEVVSGTYTVTGSGTKDVTNYASASIASGSASTPATTVTANPTISVSNGGLITASVSTTKSVTPSVSAGWVASGTAGTITVSGSNTSQLTAQAAQTITPTTSDQTIASGKFLTGAQTIEGIVCTNLTAANIADGVTVKIGTATDDDSVASVTGTHQGGGGEAEDKDVNFYDVDGKRIYSYTWAEINGMSVLPSAPDIPSLNLQFSGWNWTLAEIKAQPGYCEVGACYEPTDCDCAAVIELNVPSQLAVTIRFYTGTGNTVSLDWGDGSAAETYAASSSQYTPTHTYSACGRYRVKLTRASGTNRIGPGGSANANAFIGVNNDKVSQSIIKELYLSSNCYTNTVLVLGANLKRCVCGLNAKFNTGTMYSCGAVFIIPRDSDYARDFSAVSSPTRSRIIPAGTTKTPFTRTNGFRYCGSEKITIPAGVTSLGTRCVSDMARLKCLHVPASVTTIATTGIGLTNDSYATSAKEVWFHGTTPPTASASTCIVLTASVRIFVPYSAIAAYLTETNYPDPSTYVYIGFATYANSTTLPAVDSTNAYNLAWYATADDAASGSNAISTGNGNRVYCRAEAIS